MRDWTLIANRLPSGAFVQGNPNAPVKLVEYLSLTCPHCAHFEAEAVPLLVQKYIRTGLVSYEVRHALRDPFDFAASLLARCDGPEKFFTTLPAIYAQQDAWYARGSDWAQTAQVDGEPPEQVLPKAAAGAGLDAIFAQRGLPAAKADACLTDPKERALLVAMADEAWKRPNFPGTPAFLINNQAEPDINSWTSLDRALTAALKQRHS